jgi:hypothetical protein
MFIMWGCGIQAGVISQAGIKYLGGTRCTRNIIFRSGANSMLPHLLCHVKENSNERQEHNNVAS